MGFSVHDPLGTVLYSQDRELGAVLRIRRDSDDLGPLFAKHLGSVGVERRNPIPLAKDPKSVFVALGASYQVDLGPVRQGLGERNRRTFLVKVELTMNVDLRHWAVDVIDVPLTPVAVWARVGPTRADVVQHTHPPYPDDCGPILRHSCSFCSVCPKSRWIRRQRVQPCSRSNSLMKDTSASTPSRGNAL